MRVERIRPGRLTGTIAGLVALVTVGCFGESPRSPVPSAGAQGPGPVYVAVGASDSVGVGADDPLQDAWPRLFWQRLPREWVYVNLGVPGATVADALRLELDAALELEPDLVTVWLNVNDLIAGVEPEAYERDLDTLIETLRRDGQTTVLLATTPSVERLPAYEDCRKERDCPFSGRLPEPDVLASGVARYNASIRAVAARRGATIVDLFGWSMGVAEDPTELVSDDGFHPSTKGHRAISSVFAEALPGRLTE